VDALAAMSEVVTAGTALAGFILVYIGSLVSGYEAYNPTERGTVRGRFVARAYLSAVGFVLGLISAALAITAIVAHNQCTAVAAVVVLGTAFLSALVATLKTVGEIR